MSAPQPYPRPDFERTALSWQSLNGPWEFLFDDDDIGLTKRWHTVGLPDSVTVSGASKTDASSQNDSILRGIVGQTTDLIKENVLARSSDETHQKRQIQVPFVFQSPASGVNDRGVHEVMWYERTIADLRTAADKEKGSRLVVRFGAVDYLAKVWLNGQPVGGHRGGHVPFELDLTDALETSSPNREGAHRLTVRVFDSAYDLTQPRGKQYWNAKPENIWYTPSGGIWQNVWLEVVPAARIADSSGGTVLRSDDIESGKLHGRVTVSGRRTAQALSVQLEASYAGVSVSKSEVVALPKDKDLAEVDLDMRLSQEQTGSLSESVLQTAPLNSDGCWRNGVALWSPEHPQLYDVTIRLLDAEGKAVDEVKTITGMRSLNWTTGDGTWRLNGKPYFQALCLDQGYWPESFMTPPSAEALKTDIELAKNMGFNGCRKHQKVEDPVFYYYADRLGYLVWGEMASSYQFSPEYVERFDAEWVESMKLAINHPSVVTWTPVNESWGYTSLKDSHEQRNHLRSLYFTTKTLDPTRSINENCGWEHVVTDLTTFHDYADGPELEKTCADLSKILDIKARRPMFVARLSDSEPEVGHKPGAPVMCTEFGGVNIAAAKKEAKADGGAEDWGYTTASDPEDLLKRFEKLVNAVTTGGYCCAFVYTQLTDIEQETNGLYSFNRQAKMDPAKVKAVMERAIDAYYKGPKKTA